MKNQENRYIKKTIDKRKRKKERKQAERYDKEKSIRKNKEDIKNNNDGVNKVQDQRKITTLLIFFLN